MRVTRVSVSCACDGVSVCELFVVIYLLSFYLVSF